MRWANRFTVRRAGVRADAGIQYRTYLLTLDDDQMKRQCELADRMHETQVHGTVSERQSLTLSAADISEHRMLGQWSVCLEVFS